MEKVLTIDGKRVPFKCTGGFLIRYKQLTGSDPIKDIYNIGTALDGAKGKNVDLSSFDIDVIYNLIWIMARTANPEVPDLLTWLDSFDDFPVFMILMDLKDMLAAAFKTSKTIEPDSKKKTITIKK